MLVDAINQQGDFTVEGFCENAHTDIHVRVYVFVCVNICLYKEAETTGPRASTSLVAYYSSSN